MEQKTLRASGGSDDERGEEVGFFVSKFGEIVTGCGGGDAAERIYLSFAERGWGRRCGGTGSRCRLGPAGQSDQVSTAPDSLFPNQVKANVDGAV